MVIWNNFRAGIIGVSASYGMIEGLRGDSDFVSAFPPSKHAADEPSAVFQSTKVVLYLGMWY